MHETLKSRSDVTVVLIFFVCLALAGILAGSFFVRDYARARASISWLAVDGVVLSRLDHEPTQLRYAYSVDGRTYESSRERVFNAQFLQSESRNYLPGEIITIFVDPQNHSFSVVETGGASVAFVFFSLVSGICIFFGVGGIVWTLSEGAAEEIRMAADGAYQ